MYNKDEHESKLTHIADMLQADTIDIVGITSELNDLRENYEESLSYEKSANDLKEKNSNLQSKYMDLFIKYGESKNNKEPPIVKRDGKENVTIKKEEIHNGLDVLANEFLGKKE